jgi:Spy/CpxP family protein refolding chaperone
VPHDVVVADAGIVIAPEQQRATITEAIKALQARVVDLRWQMQEAQERLTELLAQVSVQETAALAQVDRVLECEREIKKAHLSALVRIKNALSPEQQEKLNALKRPTPRQPGRF